MLCRRSEVFPNEYRFQVVSQDRPIRVVPRDDRRVYVLRVQTSRANELQDLRDQRAGIHAAGEEVDASGVHLKEW